MEYIDFLSLKEQHLSCIRKNIQMLTENLCTAKEEQKDIIQELIQFNKAYENVGGINLDYIDTEWYEVIINLKPYDELYALDIETFNFAYENLTKKFEELLEIYDFEKGDGNPSYSFYIKHKKPIRDIKPKYNLILPCLFAGDSNEHLTFFYDYYRSQGVQKFFMYYNGDLSTRVSTLPKFKDVDYLEINVPLHDFRPDRNNSAQWWNYVPTSLACKNVPNWALRFFDKFQWPFLQIIKYRYLPLSKYTLSVDVDEFFYCKNNSLVDFLDEAFKETKEVSISMESKYVNIVNNSFVYLKNSILARRKYIHASERVNISRELQLHWGPCKHINEIDREKIEFFHLCSKDNHSDRFDYTKHKEEDLNRVPIIL